MFGTAKRMVKINQDIIVEQCIGNDAGVLAVSDEDEENNLEKLSCEKIKPQSLHGIGTIKSQADAVSSVPCLIGKGIVRESISNMKNGKAA